MEDSAHRVIRVEEDGIVSGTPFLDLVQYQPGEESVTFLGSENLTTRRRNTKTDDLSEPENMQQTEQAESKFDGEEEQDTVALLKASSDSSNSLCSCLNSYRSPDPEKRVTPFAVFLLMVLFLVYILNQADRLVLPVAIPSGLRCEGSVQDECRGNLSNESAAEAANHTDCVHFNDNEQGLLTGEKS